MELRILGPVELLVDGRPVFLARRQQRLILGILALEANRLVSLERLIHLLWSGNPPRKARAILQTRVSEIRLALSSHFSGRRVLVAKDGGYLLNIAPEAVDLHTFQTLVKDARRAESDEDVSRLLWTARQLWRGPVMGGWLPSDPNESLCASIEEARLTADEDLSEVELRLGRHHLVVDQLTQVAARHLGRERLVGLTMIALHRSGRTAEALRHFERSRRWLAAELGVDPGSELRALYLSMLYRDPTAHTRRAGMPTVPHLLPSVTPDFTGREFEVARVRALLTAEGSTVRLAAVTGPAGIGKTTLSIYVAHQVAEDFTDGQLHADLRGHDRRAAAGVADVLASFLRALGVSHIPDDLDERAGLYRDLLAGRKILVVLDNAYDADQVRTLLPGAATCAVLVSSRARLGAAIGAASTELDALDDPAAIRLLTVLADRSRVEREPEVAADIVRLCGGLPLAIRVVAARLNAKPHWALSELRTRLADERKRLDHLAYGGLDVRASIALSFNGLSLEARHLLRRLAGAATADVNPWSTAVLLGTSIGNAEELLEQLHDARLLDANGTSAASGHHRYRLPDLVRLVAADQAPP